MRLPSFLSFLGGKKAADEYPGTWTQIGGDAYGVDERNLLTHNKEWVFIATDRVASSLSSIRFKVMRFQNNGDDQETFSGPLVEFLEKPAQQFTGKDFLYLNTASKELTGNAFWEIIGRGQLKPLIATSVAPVVENGELQGYKYSEGGTQRFIAAKNVLHDRYVDPARPYWGVGKLAKIARWVDTSSYANEFLRRFFINGATFGGFIETEEESQERIKLIKAGLQNDHVGVEKAHKIGILPKGAKYQATTKNMSEIEMGATDDRYRDKILSAFGVPKTLVGLTTEVNRATAEASEYVYAKYTIKPIADDLIDFLNVNVAPTLDSSGKFYFAYDEFVPVNMELELKEREIALARQSYKTVNEVRAEVGLPPVKGGDIIYGTPFQTPLGEPMAAPEPAVEDEDEEDTEDEPKAPQKAIPAHIRKGLIRDRAINDIASKIAKVVVSHTDPDAEAHKSFVSRVDAHQKIVANKLRDFNNRQERDVVLKLKQITKDVSKGDLFDMGTEVGILVDFITPLLKGLMLEQAIDEYDAQGFAGAFEATNPRISTIIAKAAKRVAKSYNNTTANLLKQQLNDGIKNGEDLFQLTERVKTVYEFSNQVRAAMVAHTEAFYIANEGSKEAYRQSGVVESLRWYTAEDELVCEFCGPENGKIIGVNEDFHKKGETIAGTNGGSLSLDYRAIDVPPLHTNCRCFIRPEIIDIE